METRTLFLIVFVFYSQVQLLSGELESIFEQCCTFGTGWAQSRSNCKGFPSPVPGLANEHQATCLSAVEICCIRSHRQKRCEWGKEAAHNGHECIVALTIGGEAQKDCCEGCKLGLIAASQKKSCVFTKFAFGSPWDETFYECCSKQSNEVLPQPHHFPPLPGRNKTRNEDMDECALFPGQLCAHLCINTPDSYRCECYPGFRLHPNGKSCVQGSTPSKCDTNNPCAQKCIDTGVAVQCACYPGYILAPDKHSCVDVNECETGAHACNPVTEECRNTIGGFQCFEKGGTVPRSVQLHKADPCPEGYSMNREKGTCDDVDECMLHMDNCVRQKGVCINEIGSFSCKVQTPTECFPGFKYHNVTKRCTDVDECAEGLDDCNRDQEFCLNSFGGYQCQPRTNKECPAGYKWNKDQGACEDTDECVENLHNCEEETEECRNTVGGYECDQKCPPGFSFNLLQRECVDIDECIQQLHRCGPTETCINTVGGYNCQLKIQAQCPPGYKLGPRVAGAAESCVDVDECEENLHACDLATETCMNSIGSYGCLPTEALTCPTGFQYVQNFHQCMDVDECAEGLDNCDKEYMTCTNTNGSFTCHNIQPCPAGYKSNPVTHNCEDINECLEGTHQCNPQTQQCINVPGNYQCQTRVLEDCPRGYRYNRSTTACDDINECAEASDSCNRQTELCVNIFGSYRCLKRPTCLPGFVFDPQQNSCVDIDECSDGTHNCNLNKETCSNIVGTFRCNPKTPECPHGYKKNSSTHLCEDINECTENTHDCDLKHQYCVNTLGSYQCQTKIVPPVQKCGTGFVTDPSTGICKDIDECADGTHTCQPPDECVNTRGSYHCVPVSTVSVPSTPESLVSETTSHPRVRGRDRPRGTEVPRACRPGFVYNRRFRSCVDINECEEHSPCPFDQLCDNTLGSYRCVCRRGFIMNSVTRMCEDINECQRGMHNCLESSQRCDNTLGSFTCVRVTSCGTGYTLNAGTGECEDDDECILNTHTCETGYVCRNTLGSFRCDRVHCPHGQKLLADGTCQVIICGIGSEMDSTGKCVDINECNNHSVCRANQRCINTIGSYRCQNLLTCPNGFEMNEYGSQCVDIDECARRIHECRPNQICQNRKGGYACTCPAGYKLNARQECEDLDECTHYQQICPASSECQNTQGSYICNCKAGFKGIEDGRNCVDIDECSQSPNVCQHICRNSWGSYKCSCQQGFTLAPDGRSCHDIDECALAVGRGNLCIGFCVNKPGSYSCSCPDGYRLGANHRTCQDIDECQEQNVCKGEHEVCLNTRGGYKCNTIICPPNYVRDQDHKNRCKRSSSECRRGFGDCLNEPLSYSYNYITFVSGMKIVPSGQIDLFTMRGPRTQSTTVQFFLTLKDARAPEGIPPANRDYFHLRRTSFNEAMISLVKSIQGPQEIELELTLKLFHSGLYGGSAIAKIFIFVTQYEF